MNKEKIITIVIGLLVGVTVATIYFFLTRYLPAWRQSQDKVTFSPSDGEETVESSQSGVTITQPDDHSSTTSSTISLVGQSQPGIKLVVFANAEEKIASADANGNFKVDVKLEEGENEISLSAIDTLGNISIARRNITLEIIQ